MIEMIDQCAFTIEIDRLVADFVDTRHMQVYLRALRTDFRNHGFCKITSLVPETVKLLLWSDIERCLERGGSRRDLRIKVTDNSPRSYFSVDRDDVFAHSRSIPSLYRSEALLACLEAITGEPKIIPVPYRPEEVVINCMQRQGDEHGWHWDDYRYSLVWMFHPPRRGNGGEVQIVRDTSWDKADPQIDRYLQERPIESHYVERGTAYLIKGDTTMHRVSPLLSDDTRIISTFSYAGSDERDRVVTHETMQELYPTTFER